MSGIELDCSVGTLEVSAVVLRLPLRGNWLATLDIGWPEAPTEGSPATLHISRTDGTVDSFVGTVRRTRLLAGTERLSVTVVGGAGRLLEAQIPAVHHVAGAQDGPAGLVAKGIVEAAGEQLAAGVEQSLDATLLPRYTRAAGEAWAALDVFAGVLGLGWRVMADGTVWVGAETWPAVDADLYFSGGDPRDGTVTYTPDGAPYRPGTTIDGMRAVELLYRIEPGKSFLDVRGAMPGDPVRSPPLDVYRASYAGEVKAQRDDGTLDVLVDDTRIGSLLGIPLRVGIPGCKVTVPDGARVAVLFEGADPRGAYAAPLDQDDDADKAVARVDDTVGAGALVFTPGTGGAALVYYPPGTPITPPPIFPQVTLNLSGKITSGHPRILLTSEGQ